MRKSGQYPISAIDIETMEVVKAEEVILAMNSCLDTLKTNIMAHIGYWFNSEEIGKIEWEEQPDFLECRIAAYVSFADGQTIAIGINEEN